MIHQYKLNGYNIVVDVYSGGVHWVDDVAYDIIRLFCEKKPDEIIPIILEKYSSEGVTEREVEECLNDIETLKAEGRLFTEDIFRPDGEMLKDRPSPIKALCLHVAHACDLTCSYCFAGQGKFSGPSALMTFDVAKRAMDFLIENSGNHVNLEVDFFGGEPLLNFDVVKETVAYARSREDECGKRFRFTLTTNGMGITDEVIDFTGKECHNVVLSLDGRREIHDRERKTRDGLGSYDIIVPKFQRLVGERTGKGRNSNNTSYYIRGTFTHQNPDFLNDIKHMTELGFTELSMEPVVCSPDSPFALTEEDLPILMNQYEELAKEMLRREEEAISNPEGVSPGNQPFNFYHYMLDMAHGPCIYKRISGCGSGTEYFAVTPKGELYPCHQFVGEKEFLMGDIWNGITASNEEFKSCNVYARKECDDCWARLYCSGGCAANSYHASGSIKGIYEYGCKLFKKRMECAIMMEVERACREESFED